MWRRTNTPPERKFHSDPNVIEVLEKVFKCAAIAKLVTMIPGFADKASGAEEDLRTALTALDRVGKGLPSGELAHLHSLLESIPWSEYAQKFIDEAIKLHFHGAINNLKASSDAFPLFEAIVVGYAEVFAKGLSVIAQALTVGAFEILGAEGVLTTLDGAGDALGLAGGAIEELVGEGALELVQEGLGEALPVVGGFLGICKLGRGMNQLTLSVAKGVAGGCLQATGILVGNTKTKSRGVLLRQVSRLHLQEGAYRSQSGIMSFVGQIPGMCIATIPVSVISTRAANRQKKQRDILLQYAVVCNENNVSKMEKYHVEDNE